MKNILEKIIEHKKLEVAQAKQRQPFALLRRTIDKAPAVRNFIDALKKRHPAIIAEIKKASPSKGIIRKAFTPSNIAKRYANNGAACLSVLTDQRFFLGCKAHLIEARKACDLPVLRKDFIIDSYQVYEARAIGADCILLIVAALTDIQLSQFTAIAHNLGMHALIEVHNKDELKRALNTGSKLIGINNRDLKTFKTDLKTTINLLKSIPSDKIIVTESGINTREDIKLMQKHGINVFLIGEALMREDHIGNKLKQLMFD